MSIKRINVQFKKLTDTATIPFKAHPTDAGFDLVSDEGLVIPPYGYAKIHTGFSMAIPNNFVGVIFPRSSMFCTGIDASGVIDSGYRGEVMVMLHNHTEYARGIDRGMKIAQMLISELPDIIAEEVEELPSGERGTAGFGSSGI